jgi:hypothetical protein
VAVNPIRAWNAFWFRPVSARPLGAFRIVFGLVMIANLGFMAVDLDYWYTNAGLLRGTEAREAAGPLRFSALNYIQDPVSVRLWFGATALAAVGLTVGWHSRVMALVFYLMMLSIHHRDIPTNSGADALVTIMSFYMVLCPSGAAYSLDARRAARNRGTRAEPLIPPWPQRLIQLQVSLVYLSTAMWKCRGGAWVDGTALHYVLYNSELGHFDLSFLTQYRLLVDLMTHGALVIEFAMAFLLWFRPTRRWVIVVGLSLHVGIQILVNIPIFGELMTACYLLFLAPDELDALLRRLNPMRWFDRSLAFVPHSGPIIPGRVDLGEPFPWHGPHEPEEALVPSSEDLVGWE